MDPIYEITAAPHVPSALKPHVAKNNVVSLTKWLNLANSHEVEVEMRHGEIYVTDLAA